MNDLSNNEFFEKLIEGSYYMDECTEFDQEKAKSYFNTFDEFERERINVEDAFTEYDEENL